MLRQETSNHVERANRVTRCIENLNRRGRSLQHSHIVRAETVVEKGQRMKQDSPSFRSKKTRQLSDNRLRFATDLMTQHDHKIAGGICQHLTRGIDVSSFNSGSLCGERVICRVSQGENNRVFSSRSNMQKH